jgi:nucleotide-binding universal stress UspA family protein
MREYHEFTMKRIMVATDFSDVSYGPLNYAKQLAKCFSAKILLVHIVDEEQSTLTPELFASSLPDRMDAAEAEIQRMASGVTHDDLACSVIVRTGHIQNTILDLIHQRDIDLLVVGTRGKGYANGGGLGSVAEMLLRAMPCPVLTVGRGVRQDAYENTHGRRVLFPTDFSQTSYSALPYTENLAKHLGARLLLLHVDENDGAANHSDEFKQLRKRMSPTSVPTETVARAGNVATTILEVSTERQVDFIVIGVHGADQAAEVHNFGVAFGVIRQAKCPVFTLFAPSHKSDSKGKIDGTVVAHQS